MRLDTRGILIHLIRKRLLAALPDEFAAELRAALKGIRAPIDGTPQPSEEELLSRLDEVYQATLAGEPALKIAKRLGVLESRVHRDRRNLKRRLPDEFAAAFSARISRGGRRDSSERLDSIYQGALAGQPAEEMAKSHALSTHYIYSILNQLLEDLPEEFSDLLRSALTEQRTNKRRKSPPEEHLDDVYQLSLARERMDRIAEQLEIPLTTIKELRAYLHANLPEQFDAELKAAAKRTARPANGPPLKRIDEVYQAALARELVHQTAERLGVTRKTLRLDRLYLQENLPAEFSAAFKAVREDRSARAELPRERPEGRLDEVYQSLLAGESAREVAARLAVSESTVHVDRHYLNENLPDEFPLTVKRGRPRIERPIST